MQFLDEHKLVLMLGRQVSVKRKLFYLELWHQMESGNECLLIQSRFEKTQENLIKQFSDISLSDFYNVSDEEECFKIADKLNNLPLHQVVRISKQVPIIELIKPFVKRKVKHIFIQRFDLTDKNANLVLAELYDFACKNNCYIFVDTKRIENVNLSTYKDKIIILSNLNLMSQAMNTVFVYHSSIDGKVYVECLTPGSNSTTS